MVEYLLWQQEACVVASGMMQKTVEFHLFAFPEQPLHNSSFLGIPLSLQAYSSVFLGKDLGTKWVWLFKSVDKTYSGLWNWSWTSTWQGNYTDIYKLRSSKELSLLTVDIVTPGTGLSIHRTRSSQLGCLIEESNSKYHPDANISKSSMQYDQYLWEWLGHLSFHG